MLRNNIKREYPDRPISAVAGVVIHNNSVLLVKKSNLEDIWSFPGGAIEIGETLHEALMREILEETSIIIKVGDQIENVNVIRKDANDKIKNAIHHLSQWKYIDLCSPMLETGYEKFYGEDPLHMNILGYSLLSKLIRDELSIFNN